jgi:hypothetical protein
VVAIDDIHDMVRIHYEGWDVKFDEVELSVFISDHDDDDINEF